MLHRPRFSQPHYRVQVEYQRDKSVCWEFGVWCPSKPLKCLENHTINISVHLSIYQSSPFIYLICLKSFYVECFLTLASAFTGLGTGTSKTIHWGCNILFLYVCLFVRLYILTFLIVFSFMYFFCSILFVYKYLNVLVGFCCDSLYFFGFGWLQTITFWGRCPPLAYAYIRPWQDP